MTDKPDIPDIAAPTVVHDGNLHDRIAAALKAVDDMRVCKLTTHDIKFMADAVIADLGLRQETTYRWKNGRTYPAGTRYATKWEGP